MSRQAPAVIPSGITPRNRNMPSHGTLLRQPHPEWLIEAAFICYIEGGCNVPAAMKLLKDQWDAFAPFDVIDVESGEVVQEEYREIPRNTWYSWRKRYDWDAKAVTAVGARFPELTYAKAARAFLAGDIGMAYLIKTVGEDDPKISPRDKIEAAKTLVMVAGEGTLGSINRTAPVVKAIQGQMEDFLDKSPEDINRELRSLIHRTNTPHPERRR